jgi:hypothetical protein
MVQVYPNEKPYIIKMFRKEEEEIKMWMENSLLLMKS